jgi:alpha-tubulin suppressor-like RCC1 family protein
MSARSVAMVAGLLAALSACTHNVLILEAKEERDASDGEAEAGAERDADTERDAGSELDASDDGGAIESDAGSKRVPALAAYEHSCVVRDQGAFCWGRNVDGQLGIGGEPGSAILSPRHVVRSLLYTQLCAGERHSCGLRPDGRIDCWGGNAKGQLGLGDRSARDEPTALRPSINVDFKEIACGGAVSCAVGKDEQLYCWGENLEGQGGQNDLAGSPDLLVPTRVEIEPGIAQVSVGQGHVCASTKAGTSYCWGRNNHGQLGLGRLDPDQVRKPTPLAGGGAYLALAAGQNHSCAVRKDGHLFCWGQRIDGRLGLGPGGNDDLPEPTQVGSLSDYQSVQGNWFHSCALRRSGVLMCWGRNGEGQLGVGDTELRDEPTNVMGLDAVSAFAVGHFHTCATRSDAVYCWGENREGQLGLGNEVRRAAPTRLSF